MPNDKIRFDGTGTVVDVNGYLYQVGTQITSTAAELNLLDGVSATTAELNKVDGLTATTTEINYVADASAYAKQAISSVTASTAITPGVRNVVFSATAVPTASIAATMASAVAHAGMFTAVQRTTDTVGHTIVISTGTFDGTNNKATFNANGEALVVAFDSAGAGTIVINNGAVALSTT